MANESCRDQALVGDVLAESARGLLQLELLRSWQVSQDSQHGVHILHQALRLFDQCW